MNKLKNTIVIVAIALSSTFIVFAQEAINVDAAGNVIISETLNVKGTINTSEKKICEKGEPLIPRGVIVMWFGDIPSIPKGWVLCDGQNKTPDLRSRFIVGASASGSGNGPAGLSEYEFGNFGGQEFHTLTTAEMPSHAHSFSDIFYSNRMKGDADEKKDGSSGDTDDDNTYHSIGSITNPAGGNGAHENRPPFYALAYIMKE